MIDGNSPQVASEDVAQALLADDRHYVAAVTTMGDQQAVVAAEDILGASGVKLIAKGSQIDSRLREKLSGHQLRPLLDCALSATNCVSAASLAAEADTLIREQPFWRQLAGHSGDAMAMRHGLARLKLPPAIAFKLTVARSQRPLLFAHGLRVALLCHYLALRLGYSEKATANLQLAALCHDLGEMHTDPAILDPGHRISEAERRFVYVHPATGYLILRDIAGIPAEVARAVRHHHERLDGSGYPAGLSAPQIEPLALPLMVADTAEAVLGRCSDHGRLSTLLRLNRRKYDNQCVALLHEAILAQGGLTKEPETSADVRGQQLMALAVLLNEWDHFRQSIDPGLTAPGQPGLGFLHERLRNLNSLLYQFGFDPANFDALNALAESDPEVAAELSQVLDELQFQLADMAREIDRRQDEIRAALPELMQIAFADWRSTLRRTLSQ